MEGAFDFLTDALLMMMSLLGIIRVRRLEDAMTVLAAMLQIGAEELFREVELYIEEHWPNELSELDVYKSGKNYFVGEAAAHRANPLLLEASCRLKNVQLTVWDYERHSCEIYGHHGPMYNAAIINGSFIALIGRPVMPWYQKVHHELDPSTSHVTTPQPQTAQLHPMETAPGEVILVRGEHLEAQMEEASHREVATQWEEMAPVFEVEYEPQDLENTEPHNEPEDTTSFDQNEERQNVPAATPATHRQEFDAAEDQNQPTFHPADVTGLPPHMVAELLPPQQAPYEYRNNKIVCCLPHCKIPRKEFSTVGGWKKHVALAQYHLSDAFCALCGHFLILPDGLQPEQIKAYIKAHKAERCVAASKTVMRQRRVEVARLEALMRTASHIQLSDEDGMAQEPVEENQEPPAARRKRAYPTEEARRADICVTYLKRFKRDHPETMTEIAEYHGLQIP